MADSARPFLAVPGSGFAPFRLVEGATRCLVRGYEARIRSDMRPGIGSGIVLEWIWSWLDKRGTLPGVVQKANLVNLKDIEHTSIV